MRTSKLSLATAWHWAALAVLPGCVGGCPLFTTDLVGLPGEPCSSEDACFGDLVCTGFGECQPRGFPGTAGDTEECLGDEFCRLGFVCGHDGTCTRAGEPGTIDRGDTCEADEDCRFGYTCIDGECGGLQPKIWLGAECAPEEADQGRFRAYFEVPAAGEPATEFYRLPFPNDARVDGGVLDLAGHPSPGELLPELGDVVGDILDGFADDFDGFGNNQAAFLRTSRSIDFDDLSWGLPQEGGTYGIVDLTPGDDFGAKIGTSFQADTSRGQYICSNWISIAPPSGRPYEPGHTYGVYLTTGIGEADGNATLEADDDFAAMLATEAPSDARLQRAWEAYQPLRDWVAQTDGLSADQLASAAVFTVADPTEPFQLLRQAVANAPVPAAQDLHLCEGGAPGPFDDPGDPGRGCGPLDGEVALQVQGRLPLAQFQAGLPPFKDLDDGGRIDFSGGVPTPTFTEPVEFTLTVPNAPMPAGGWPLVIYGHGSGGSQQSAVRGGVAEAAARIPLDDGTVVRFATLTFDAVAHGPRRHPENWKDSWLSIDESAYDPDVLFFNPVNPLAARDNAAQAAADAWQVVRWATGVDWTAAESPTGRPLRFDPDHLHYLGHSQGGQTGVAAVAYEPAFAAATFSGTGGLFINALLDKTQPRDLSAAVAIALADPDPSRFHPVLNALQAASERSDSINHAIHVAYAPYEGNEAKDVLQVYGLGDSYSPDSTQFPLARALRTQQVVGAGVDPLSNLTVVQPPVSANLRSGATGVTATYANAGEDAHFVLFDRDDAWRQTLHFHATAVADGRATVVTAN